MENKIKNKNKLKIALIAFMLLALSFAVSPISAQAATQQSTGPSQILMQIFSSLLQSLMGMVGGGSTPQTGSVDEQIPIFGSINPTRSGQPKYGTSYGNSNYYSTGSGTSETTDFDFAATINIADSNGAASINSGDRVSFQNSTSATQTMQLKNSSGTVISENSIAAYSSVPFKFVTAGTYSVCTISGTTETCGSTLNVN